MFRALNGTAMAPSSADQEGHWAALMKSAQDGDGGAYARLLREVTPFVRAIARRRFRNEHEVEDVVQEVLLSLHRVRRTYDPSRPFKPWLAAIANRRIIDALRRKIRLGEHEVTDELAYETFADPQSNREVEASAAAQLLTSALESLPPGQREALELVKLKEMSLNEASALTGQSTGGLKVSVHRAIKALKARLGRSE
jgi:RNA polymerase sigma-70 factor (ECF subfamily)